MLYHVSTVKLKVVMAHCPPLPHRSATDAIEGTAIGASILCLAHCLALPLLLLILPGTLAVFARSSAVHLSIFLLVAPFAFVALGLGYRRHRRPLAGILGMLGIACLGAALVPALGEPTARIITVIGSLLLVTGHVLNWRQRAHAH